jgi:hypothetical protein
VNPPPPPGPWFSKKTSLEDFEKYCLGGGVKNTKKFQKLLWKILKSIGGHPFSKPLIKWVKKISIIDHVFRHCV